MRTRISAAVVLALPVFLIAAEPAELQFYDRSFEIPFSIPASIDCASVRVFVSGDKGKTWKLHQEIKRTDDVAYSVKFKSDKDGLYSFALQVVTKKMSLDPPTEKLSRDINVRVDTSKPVPPPPALKIQFEPPKSELEEKQKQKQPK